MSAEPKKMKVAELREALEARGLDSKGKKADLVARLEEAMLEDDEADDADSSKADIGTSAPQPEKASSSSAAAAAAPAAAAPAATAVAGEDAGSFELQIAKLPEQAAEDVRKRKKRAERFGGTFEFTAREKEMMRAARFGLAVNASSGPAGLDRALAAGGKKRGAPAAAAAAPAKRQAAAAPKPLTPEEEERRRKRTERFKTPAAAAAE